MSIAHHPDDAVLLAFAAGSLDAAQRLTAAAHCGLCPACAGTVARLECLGGAWLEEEPEATLAAGAATRAIARLDDARPILVAPIPQGVREPYLPPFLTPDRLGPWRWLAPRVEVRKVAFGEASPTRALLLRAAPGTKLLPHDHTALEWTCVLQGAFEEGGVTYGRGDFAAADSHDHHAITIAPGGPCVCLVAMQGDLKWRGALGRIANLFVRL